MATNMSIDNDSAHLAISAARRWRSSSYGSQGHAHALNLKDSGGGREGGPRGREQITCEGRGTRRAVDEPGEVAKWADVVMILVPDTTVPPTTRKIEPNLTPGNMLMFAQGFNIRFVTIVPRRDIDVTMIAPKRRVTGCASSCQKGRPPALSPLIRMPLASRSAFALSNSKGIGDARAGVIETTFTEEDGTDLFRRAGDLLRWHQRAGEGGIETLVRGAISPSWPTSMPPRAEAHCRSHVPGRHQLHALFGEATQLRARRPCCGLRNS